MTDLVLNLNNNNSMYNDYNDSFDSSCYLLSGNTFINISSSNSILIFSGSFLSFSFFNNSFLDIHSSDASGVFKIN
jgi:hypothetical protein